MFRALALRQSDQMDNGQQQEGKNHMRLYAEDLAK